MSHHVCNRGYISYFENIWIYIWHYYDVIFLMVLFKTNFFVFLNNNRHLFLNTSLDCEALSGNNVEMDVNVKILKYNLVIWLCVCHGSFKEDFIIFFFYKFTDIHSINIYVSWNLSCYYEIFPGKMSMRWKRTSIESSESKFVYHDQTHRSEL